MAAKPLETKRGDRKTALLFQLQRGDGTIADLTGLVVADIKIHIKNIETGVVTVASVSAIVAPPTDGKVSYNPTTADVANVGEFEIEIQVTHPGGLTETFPVCDRFFWKIVADLA